MKLLLLGAITGMAVIAANDVTEPFINSLPESYKDYADFLVWIGVISVCVYCYQLTEKKS